MQEYGVGPVIWNAHLKLNKDAWLDRKEDSFFHLSSNDDQFMAELQRDFFAVQFWWIMWVSNRYYFRELFYV